MIHVEPKDISTPQVHKYLLCGVGPRPIALVSTVNEEGKNNLAPFSFFNAFGANPPMVAFSSSRRVRDASQKDTYHNLMATRECVIQAVTHSIVEQVNLASVEYPSDVDEFEKSGLTPIHSDLVKPRRVKESPFQMECRLFQMVPLGEGKGSGNLAICEVVKFHVSQDILTNGEIDPLKVYLVGRMGGEYYTKAYGKSLFEVPRVVGRLGIGYDALPAYIKSSHIYTANNLGRFGLVDKIPSPEEVQTFIESLQETNHTSLEIFERHLESGNYQEMARVGHTLRKRNHPHATVYLERTARCALEKGDLLYAWKVAIYASM